MENAPLFSRLMAEYGNLDDSKATDEMAKGTSKAPDSSNNALVLENGDTVLMSTEERNTGAVSLSTYKQYLRYAGGVVWAPGILLLLILFQAAQGMFPFIWTVPLKNIMV
jgi:ATP-binding cassette subfamily C (CFTR/MRP) protein 1